MVRERVGDWKLSWRFALAGLAAGLLVIAIAGTGVSGPAFDAAQDQLFPAPAPDPQVTLVAIDSKTLRGIGAYPWHNGYHAEVINYLASLRPKVILFDIVLDHHTGVDPETREDTDKALSEAIKNAGNVVLACTADAEPRPEFATVAAAVGDRALHVPDRANAMRGMALRQEKSCSANESNEPAFIQALGIAQKIDTALDINGSVATFGPHRIPLDSGQMLINFTRGTSPTCPYIDAFNHSCSHPEVITNHIVVVGTKMIDAGDVYSQAVSFKHDGSFCPASRPACMLPSQNYGYRIEGDAISTVLSDRYVRTQPQISIQLAVLVFAILVGLIVYVFNLRAAVLFAAALLAAYYTGIYAVGQQGYLADPLYAPLAIVLGATFSLGARYFLEERERRKVERIFGRYIDPRVARQLAATRSVDEIIRKGERRDLTVLFMDIRGFTAMSESMRADDVLSLIQDYLDEMSKLILKWDGLIDKYVGDEVMALWNAPLPQRDHALLAVRCAYDLIANAPAVQARLAARGLPPIGWGIGVNTGSAVVGNMGSQDRLQYTALGDTVNTAERFCSAAPAFNLLVGWPTYEACKDYIAVDEMPGLQLKGKSAETFRILRVTAIREDRGSPWVPIPTDAATDAYTAKRRLYATQEVFA